MTTIEKITQYLEHNPDTFAACLEELDSYNGYLGDDRYCDMEELDEIYSNANPSEILARAFYGHDEDTYHTDAHGEKEYGPFNPNRDYFRFNGYGNLVSSNSKDYSDYLDERTISELSERRRWIDSIDNTPELADLFDELETEE